MAETIQGGAYHWHEYGIETLLPDLDDESPIVILLGCGDGAEKPNLAARGFVPFGIDVRAIRGGADVLGDAHSLPFADSSVELVLSMQVLEHLTAPWLATREIARVLKPGGWFAGSVAFLKPYHDSYFHMTHQGVRLLLSEAGLVTDRLCAAQSLTYSIYGGMIPAMSLRVKRKLLGMFDGLLFALRALAWRVVRRQNPTSPLERFDQELPLSFQAFDKLRLAPAVVFRAYKPTPDDGSFTEMPNR